MGKNEQLLASFGNRTSQIQLSVSVSLVLPDVLFLEFCVHPFGVFKKKRMKMSFLGLKAYEYI